VLLTSIRNRDYPLFPRGGIDSELLKGGIVSLRKKANFLSLFKRIRSICTRPFILSSWLTIAAGVAWPAYLLGQGLNHVISKFVYEDYFYYLKVAQNILGKAGVSLDGVNPTNGFHPLWMAICLGVVKLGGSLAAIAERGLWVCYCLLLICVWLCFVYIRKTSPRWISWLTAVFLLFNYRFVGSMLCGLETALAASLLILLALVYKRLLAVPSPGRAAIFGLLVGLVVLARTDLLLVGGVIFSDFALRLVRSAGLIRLRVLILAGAMTFLTLAPWLIWSQAHSNRLFPASRAALVLWRDPNLASWIRPDQFHNTLYQQLGRAKSSVVPLGQMAGVIPRRFPVAVILGFLGLACLTGFSIWRGQFSGLRQAPERWFLPAALLHIAFYFLFSLPEPRYLVPSFLLFVLLNSLALGRWALAKRRNMKLKIGLGAGLVAGVLLMAFLDCYHRGAAAGESHYWHSRMYHEVVPWLIKNTPESAVIGSFNAGIYSYFSGRKVVNLDGVINDNALRALKDKRLLDYIDEQRIEYLVEIADEQIESFLGRFSGVSNWRERFLVVKTFVYPPTPTDILVLRRR
jgi:hypothetical protein